jgi:hypothetical protein
MSLTTLKITQNEFLEQYLRGTGRRLSSSQADMLYGIKNLRARMSELRGVGMRVRRKKSTEGRSAYSISARDVTGSRAAILV